MLQRRVRRDAVLLRGDRHGVSLVVGQDVRLPEVVEQLRRKLAPARHFFTGGTIRLEVEGRRLEDEEWRELTRVAGEYGLTLTADRLVPSEAAEDGGDGGSAPGDRGEGAPALEALPGRGTRAVPAGQTILIRRTLRSGQKVRVDGNVVVLGDVNPGAEIVCTGDIVVMGTLRGMAHAGAGGRTDAVVVAFRLEPTQLRIAHYISRAPDDPPQRPEWPEIARVQQDRIEITAYAP